MAACCLAPLSKPSELNTDTKLRRVVRRKDIQQNVVVVKYRDRRHCVRLVRYPDRDLPLQSRGKYRERERFLSIPPGKLDVQKWPGKHLYPIICKSIYLVNSQPALQCWDERERWIRDIPWVYIIYNQGLQVKAMLCQHLRYCQLPIVFCVKLHLFSSSFP